ncbi:hypothetical protein PTKIN_Ptkin19aG0028100 [Pterospermum kingtungense]
MVSDYARYHSLKVQQVSLPQPAWVLPPRSIKVNTDAFFSTNIGGVGIGGCSRLRMCGLLSAVKHFDCFMSTLHTELLGIKYGLELAKRYQFLKSSWKVAA